MSKWICSECSHSNNSHAKYCMQCGHFKEYKSLKRPTVTWLCTICKEENHDNAKYCRKCGNWLLSENYTPTRVEKGGQKNYSKPSKIKNKNNENKTSKIGIVELILIIILVCSMLLSEGSSIYYMLIWIFFIHLLFSVIYVFKVFLQDGFIESGKMLLKHGAILVVLFVALILSINPDNNAETSVDSAITVTSNAVELEYEDLLRNANGKYKDTYVKVSGVVYHLEKGNQKNIMINRSSDPYTYQVVFVKRKEQDETVILNDNVVIYGKVSGTIGTTNILGIESVAPVIESYSLILQND